jgi:MFS family permease
MAGAAIAPSLPELARAFGAQADAELWVRRILTVPALSAAVGGPFVGVVLDRFGRRPLLLAALVLYAIAGTAGLYLPSLWWLLTSRVLMGFALTAIITAATTLIADYWEEAERGRVLGLQAGFSGFAGVFYLIGGGYLSDLHWRAPFALYAVAAVCLPLAWLHLPEVWERPTRADAPGAVAGAEFPPLYKLAIVYSLALLLMVSFFLVPLYLPFRLESIVEIDASRVGMLLGTTNLCFALAALLYRRMSGLFRVSALFAGGFAILGSGLLLLGRAQSIPTMFPGLILGGAGLGILIPNLNVWATRGLDLLVRGRVVGGLSTALYLGQFLAPLVAQPLVERVGLDGGFRIYGYIHGGMALLFAVRAFRRRGAPVIG